MSEAADRAKAWDEFKAKEKAEIARLASEANEKAEAEAETRVTDKTYAAKRSSKESVSKIRANVEVERLKDIGQRLK